jgi:large exoprotein involved in heme utilization and adhesion
VDPLGLGIQFGGQTTTYGDSQTVSAANVLIGHTYFVPVGGVPKTRWLQTAFQGPESGANAGSNYVIYRYADDGTFLGTALSISRATGVITPTQPMSMPGGIAGKAMCWKSDGRTPGYCSTAPDSGGACTCN